MSVPAKTLRWGALGVGVVLAAAGAYRLANTNQLPTRSPRRTFNTVKPPRFQPVISQTKPHPFVPISASLPALGLSKIPIQPEPDPGGVLTIPPIAQGWGWWNGGAQAGASSGPTILAGHVDWVGFGNGPAQKIWYLQPGMTVTVYSKSGEAIRYVAVALNTYSDVQMRTEGPILFRTGGPNRLYIITCGGTFIPSEHSWNSNVVGTFVPANQPVATLHVARQA